MEAHKPEFIDQRVILCIYQRISVGHPLRYHPNFAVKHAYTKQTKDIGVVQLGPDGELVARDLITNLSNQSTPTCSALLTLSSLRRSIAATGPQGLRHLMATSLPSIRRACQISPTAPRAIGYREMEFASICWLTSRATGRFCAQGCDATSAK